MRREDIPAGLRLCRASGWNQVARDWELFLESSPGGCRVAVDDRDEVVGSVATIQYGDAFAWVGMVMVDPAHRRAGVGTTLLNESLHILREVPLVRLDATPAGQLVYAQLGFGEEYGLQRMQREPDEKRGTAPFSGMHDKGAVALFSPSAGVRRMTDDDFDEVASWDREAFGADRRRLLDAFRRDAPEYTWVASSESGIGAYVFCRHGYAFEHIGPLVARAESSARALVAACAGTRPDRPFIIDVPRNAAWVAWLTSNHFSVQRPFVRMARGDRRFRENVSQMFAIAGPEFG